MKAPDLSSSSPAERAEFIRERFRCIADCDQCGNCHLLHHREAEEVFAGYIEGKTPFLNILIGLR